MARTNERTSVHEYYVNTTNFAHSWVFSQMGKYLVKEKFPIYHTFHKTKTGCSTMGCCNWEAGRRNRSPCRPVNMAITDDLVETFLKCLCRLGWISLSGGSSPACG